MLNPVISTASVPSPQLILANTSFIYTTGNNITFGEILQLNVTQTVPEGYANLSIIIGNSINNTIMLRQ